MVRSKDIIFEEEKIYIHLLQNLFLFSFLCGCLAILDYFGYQLCFLKLASPSNFLCNFIAISTRSDQGKYFFDQTLSVNAFQEFFSLFILIIYYKNEYALVISFSNNSSMLYTIGHCDKASQLPILSA